YWDNVRSGLIAPLERMEGLYRCQDGNILPVEKSIRLLAGQGNSLLAIHLHSMDEEKSRNHELESTLALVRATLESTADGILVTDLDGHIRNFNRRFAEFWSLPEKWLLLGEERRIYRCMLHRFISSKDGRSFMESARAAREQETFALLELKNDRWLECRSRPQLVEEQILGRVYTFADISARVQAEAKLQEAMQQAHAASLAKTDFLNHMSHELRTPLNAILGFAQLMQEEGCSPHEEKVDLMLKGGWHLLSLINEVLDLARVEAGKIDLQLETVHLQGILRECLALVRPMSETKSINLLNLESSPALYVHADARRLRQMVLNLLSNAIKYNRTGGKVWIALSTTESVVSIEVHDTGLGISTEDINRLFENFSRVGSTQHIEGTGIGLAFSRKLAHLMKGDIHAMSTLGQGSNFILSLPRVHHVDESPPDIQTTPNNPPNLAPLRVLYVDDDSTNRLIVKAMLRKQAVELETAETGAQALQRLHLGNIDLLIVDMHLEDMTGIDLVNHLPPPDTPGTPVRFMLSASDDAEIKIRARNAGIQRYLTKPLDIKEFLQAIAEVRPYKY
ncbi:MAG: response regulator, partial [Pseudomonadales bacterium]|nr:response regulator [Pseudomonadales bacterium]